MDMKPLGTTTLCISPIGFGAFKIGRNIGVKYSAHYELPSDGEVETLLNGVLDLGINLIDTAPAYGTSEERIGRAIAHRRDEYVLCTKVGERFENGVSIYDFSRESIARSLDESLKRLRTDRLDIVLIHSDGRDVEIMRETQTVEFLQRRKERGDIGAIGFSGKTPQGAIEALPWADVVMVEYHLNDTSHAAIILEARAQSVGVLVKKGLASGSLDAAESVSFALSNDGVDSLVIGGLNLAHIKSNVETAKKIRPD